MVGVFCSVCGASQPDVVRDPMIGRVIADRYEILAPMKHGGMGTIYVGLQRVLDRKVAIKLVRTALRGVGEIVTRFLAEARIASQFNHPNLVSIYDFGRIDEGEGTDLFLVMELLSGSDLRETLDANGPLAIPRIVDILTQTLAGLAEAHDHGISHRDIKPENIFLTRSRRGGDRAKVIDFGVARSANRKNVTMVGQFVGTPWYAAPEQLRGEHSPLSDLYSVGVVLYEMLTGKLPFEASSPALVLGMHQTEPRPNPLRTAPDREIPEALAQVCMRAMAVSPARRYPSAEEMADALAVATSAAGRSKTEASLFPRRKSSRAPPPEELQLHSEASQSAPAEVPIEDFGRIDSVLPDEAPPSRTLSKKPLIGRTEDIAWVRTALAAEATRAVVLHAETGMGRTRLVDEVVASLGREGALAVRVTARQHPRTEVGYAGLREIVVRLADRSVDAILSPGSADEAAEVGLQATFAPDKPPPGLVYDAMVASVVAALRWAAGCALERAKRSMVVLCIDDADRLDGGSLSVLGALLEGELPHGMKIILTSERAPSRSFGEHVRVRQLRGLRPDEAERLLNNDDAAGHGRCPRRDEAIEPLYIEHFRALAIDSEDAPQAQSLTTAVDARLEGLMPSQRRLLQAVAVLGEGTVDDVGSVLSDPDDVADGLSSLVAEGLLAVDAGVVMIPHATTAERALANTPAGTLSALYKRAADAAAIAEAPIELRAVFAVNSQPGFEAFLLVEEAARLRTTRGDHEGAIAMLLRGLEAARTQELRGDLAAASATAVFLRKLGTVLFNAGRAAEAVEFLEKTLPLLTEQPSERVVVLEQLATALAECQRDEDATRRRKEVVTLLAACGDEALQRRLESHRRDSQMMRRVSVLLFRAYPSTTRKSTVQSTAQRATPSHAPRRDPRREDPDVEGDAPIVERVAIPPTTNANRGRP
jgi:serine/threonine-protein kinase